MAYTKTENWGIWYYEPNSDEVRYIRATSALARDQFASKLILRGGRIRAAERLYPFNMEKNQHNFELISNICANRLHDMYAGEIPFDAAEAERLEATKERAEDYFCQDLPVAWVPWEMWQGMTAMAAEAVVHRQNACVAAGRPDLVTYC